MTLLAAVALLGCDKAATSVAKITPTPTPTATPLATPLAIDPEPTPCTTVDADSLMGRPSYFYWLGSEENFLGVLDVDATMATLPWHMRTYEPWKSTDGKQLGWKAVYERSDRVVVFLVSGHKAHGCEYVMVQTKAYGPADYERVEQWDKTHYPPNMPAPPTIP